MRALLQKCRRLLLYGGLERDQYKRISPNINEANRRSVVVLSVACLIVFVLRLCLRYAAVPMSNRIVFSCGIVLFGLLAVLNTKVKKQWLIHLSAYLFMAFYLAIGILMAVGPESVQERTTLYLVFISVAPLLFALNALELAAVIFPAEAVYLALITRLQSGYPVYAANCGNSIILAVSGLALGVYMANMKVSGIYNAYINARTEEIRQLNTELAASREHLQAALAEAESANRAKSAFLSSMSHDIRTPLNAIIGFTSLALAHIDDRKQVEDYLGKITTSGQHLLLLINDVLDMSRIESGKVEISAAPFELPELLCAVCTIVQSSVTAKRLKFSVNTEGVTEQIVVGDRLRLHQILLNILGNAVKFTPTGGRVSFTVQQLPTALEGSVDLVFRIQDSGIGMSQEFQEHIFEAFSRERTSAVQPVQGTGLGMAITKNLVDMMGGIITVDSVLGQGTQFTVQLRFAVGGEVPKEEKTEPIDFSGRRILMAEDNALNEEIAKELLTDAGFVVDAVHDGAEALQTMESAAGERYDLILMDIQMPRMNGYEATRKIRALKDPARAGIPIVAMTADAFEEDRRAALDAGMNGHISKPIEVAKLLETLRGILK